MKDIFNYRNKYTKVNDNKWYDKVYYDVNGEKVNEWDYILIEYGHDIRVSWTVKYEDTVTGLPIFLDERVFHNGFAIHPLLKCGGELLFIDESGNSISLDGLKFVKYTNNKEKILKYLEMVDERHNRHKKNDNELDYECKMLY